MSDEAKGYERGEWAGLPHFRCLRCGFGVADKDEDVAEAQIQDHVAAHLGLPADAILTDEGDAAVLDFASDEAAELFVGLDDGPQMAVAELLLAREGSGATGAFTVADVRQAIADAEADNEEE